MDQAESGVDPVTHKGLALVDLLLASGLIALMFALFVILPAWLERRAERRRRQKIVALERQIEAIRRNLDEYPGGPLVIAPDENE